MRVGVVAAHYDDEVLGCGGTIARLTAGGARVQILICAHRRNGNELVDPTTLAQYQKMARACAAVLGVQDICFGSIPDEQFPRYEWDLMKWIEAHLHPETGIVITHGLTDHNQDHAAVARAVDVAVRPWVQPAQAVWHMEVPSSSTPRFTPTMFVGLTETMMDAKRRAFEVYETELRPHPHPRSLQAIDALAEMRGAYINTPYAEAFEVRYQRWPENEIFLNL